VAEARRRAIPVIPRAEMQAELMRLGSSIAVAGAHGKTTTTSMIALVLERAGLDPTAIIGGRLSVFGSNARLGQGDYVVAEADESDRSFLRYSPTIAVITNVDYEHLENYRDFDDLCQAFVDFAGKVPFYGAVIACGDDPELRRLLPGWPGASSATASTTPAPEVKGVGAELSRAGGTCTVVRRPGTVAPAARRRSSRDASRSGAGPPQPAECAGGRGGRLEIGIPFAVLAAALGEFQGAERRFQTLGEAGGVLVSTTTGTIPRR